MVRKVINAAAISPTVCKSLYCFNNMILESYDEVSFLVDMKSHFLLTGMTTLGWDCIVIPGARKGTASATFTGDSGRPMRWCGQSEGLVTKAAAGGAAGTICCKNSLQCTV